jgi:excisionase family DNA binding protein
MTDMTKRKPDHVDVTELAVTAEEIADLANHDWRKPLAVPPRQACELLSVGLTRLYQLMNAGELESFHIGRARRITTASISAYIERQIAAMDGG